MLPYCNPCSISTDRALYNNWPLAEEVIVIIINVPLKHVLYGEIKNYRGFPEASRIFSHPFMLYWRWLNGNKMSRDTLKKKHFYCSGSVMSSFIK